MKTLNRFLSFMLCLAVMPALALVPTERKHRLTEGWEYIRGDMGSIWEVMRPVPGAGKPEAVPLWQTVTLPHCFNASDATNPDVNYYQGAGWYRTRLSVDNPYTEGRTLLEFEGAGQRTEVYLYTTLVATHLGGYDEWTADLTEAIAAFRQDEALMKRFQGRIPIAIRCDNSRDTEYIPSDMSDFNLYGGLYRYVNLVYLPKAHIRAVRIDTDVDEKGKEGTVNITIDSQAKGMADATLNLTLFSPDGKPVKQITNDFTPAFSLKRPALWSTDAPHLYTLAVELIANGDTLRHRERFGFRHFRFEEKGPFYLNGKRLLLRGTHRHEDHAGVAAALSEEMMRREMQQIKQMGANFIRLGHYQQSSLVLDLCDELGLLVWEEIPWCRGGLGGEQYKEQARTMLTNMISQHRNHPSVILWGLGNENDWPGDFEQFDQDSIRAFMTELHTLSHRLDPSRLTTIRRCDFCRDIVDVYSPSIWAGWYSRRYRDYYEMERKGFESVPRFLHAEWGGDSHPGRHEEVTLDEKGLTHLDRVEAGDRNGAWSESYIVRLFDWHLKEQERMPWLTGALCWTFKDFSTPLRPTNPIPYMNQKGVVQRDGTPKESYYVFQSYWAKEPMLHIYGHNWPVRWGKPGEKKEILVYSNCPEVELFVNGTSVGKKKRNTQDFPAAGLHWYVPLQEGENRIEAVAVVDKQTLRDEITPLYQSQPWDKPAKIRLTPVKDSANEAEDDVLICAELLDKNGNRCLDAHNFFHFGCTHPQALLQNQGTANGSRKIQAANGRAYIKVRKQAVPVIVSGDYEGLSAWIEIDSSTYAQTSDNYPADYATAPRFKALLYYTKQAEEAHVQFAEQAVRFFEKLNYGKGFMLDVTTDFSPYSYERLKEYDVVVMPNAMPQAPAERKAFEQYMENGGGWMGFHAAAYNDKNTQWPWLLRFLGGGVFYCNNWPPQPVLAAVDNAAHAVTKNLPAEFVLPASEWYQWKPSPRQNPDVEVLMSLSSKNYPLGIKDVIYFGDFPIVWTNKNYRMIYLNMGHGDEEFTDATQNLLFVNAFRWVVEQKVLLKNSKKH